MIGHERSNINKLYLILVAHDSIGMRYFEEVTVELNNMLKPNIRELYVSECVYSLVYAVNKFQHVFFEPLYFTH